jgi:ATP-dependent helicase/nuclease subunit B
MFSPTEHRLFGLPPGVDFPKAVVCGLKSRLRDAPPEAMARVTLYVNTDRMRLRMIEAFGAAGPGLLPRLRLVTDLGRDVPLSGIGPAVSPLKRRLLLAQMIEGLMRAAPDIAPRSALFDLADSLAALMDEMQGEDVSPTTISDLNVADHSAHWARTKEFMKIVAGFLAADAIPDSEGRQRLLMRKLVDGWQALPPSDPVIVAGSTGSRGTTAALMQAVARLPQGALILPGHDFDLPDAVWPALADTMTAEDHPQFRTVRLLDGLGLSPKDIAPWVEVPAPCPARNRLISLSLRPAPVTDQWLSEGKMLPDLTPACSALTLMEAPTPRHEAIAIALMLREAAETGRVVALVTPDRGLTRQVTAALDRWGITPDDSAGRPLALSPPGRLLRHVAHLFDAKLTAETLLVLLKHPLVASGAERGNHLRFTRSLERQLRRKGPAFPDRAALVAWASAQPEAEILPWMEWLTSALFDDDPGPDSLSRHTLRHRRMAEALATGPGGTPSGALWEKEAGEKTQAILTELEAEAAEDSYASEMRAADYRNLFEQMLNQGVLRETVQAHPRILILGPREMRELQADLVILGGLNDGVWPQIPPPDPWMNRQMRLEAGLLLPERRIGLAAHDYQLAIGAPEVVLSRALRNAEAETVASRWLNRLTNLLGGLPDQNGPQALAEMRSRGAYWLDLASRAEAPAKKLPAARRPAPRPPVAARPRELPVTGISRLIRDPYAIYARYILRLRKLDPLRTKPDAMMRGSVLHEVLEAFIRHRPASETRPEARARLMNAAQQVLLAEVPWPAARALWQAKLARAADFFLETEAALGGTPVVLEKQGRATIDALGFTLTAKPDRIDVLDDGRVRLFDYKTGTPPTPKQQAQFDKQLLLEAAMVLRGGFTALAGPQEVAGYTYIGLGSTPKVENGTPSAAELEAAWEELTTLIARYLSPDQGFTARRAVQNERFAGDYDDLARFGEWELTDAPEPEDVG